MVTAWVLTLLAISGIAAGVFLGAKANRFSDQLAAAGGGLLFGIALFWLVPEIGETTGRSGALAAAFGVAVVFWLLDVLLGYSGHSARPGVIWPLLLATAIHSLLDGWSVRLLGHQPLPTGEHMTRFAVAIGLALHKIPEGAAVGWITRRALGVTRQAFLAGAGVELFTLEGAWAEPSLTASGATLFGHGWTAAVLSLIAGGFLFLGLHALLPAWKRFTVVAIFVITLLLTGGLAILQTGKPG